jgi:hypothetical protein
MTQLYRIEEFYSSGWELIDDSAQKLTKEQCNQMLRTYLNGGTNPNHLRAVLDVHSES